MKDLRGLIKEQLTVTSISQLQDQICFHTGEQLTIPVWDIVERGLWNDVTIQVRMQVWNQLINSRNG